MSQLSEDDFEHFLREPHSRRASLSKGKDSLRTDSGKSVELGFYSATTIKNGKKTFNHCQLVLFRGKMKKEPIRLGRLVFPFKKTVYGKIRVAFRPANVQKEFSVIEEDALGQFGFKGIIRD